MPTAYQFLPWVRRGLTVALDAVENLGQLPAHAHAVVGVQLAGPHAGAAINPMPVQLHGPGDVIGIDTALVVRTDPRPGTTNFEPNYCAIVDFDPPDFPWMLTPARANADHRLRPWLVLVVLDVAVTGLPKMAGQAPLPSIRIPAPEVMNELPPLEESWSWAHAQVVSDTGDAGPLQNHLQNEPHSNVSRLVCPRRLKPGHHYVACVVPAFEPGRLRGLGLAGDGSSAAMQTLAPAWTRPSAQDVVLPVYHSWTFSTGPAGDFEYLARRLRSPKKWKNDPEMATLLSTVGTASMAVDGLIGGGQTTMEGALVPISYSPGALATGPHDASLQAIVNTPAQQVDNPVVDEPDGTVRRIEVKPPMWGNWHVGVHSVPLAAQGSFWLAGLNLNPRYRGAAGYGAEVVRRNQEDYVDACWDQVGDIRRAEMLFNLTRLAIEAQRALKARHFDPLPPERLVQVMGPALPRIEAVDGQTVAFKVGGATGSLGGQVDRSSLPPALLDTALRRHASPVRRQWRTVARQTRQPAAPAALGRSYVQQMAAATQKPAAFAVNDFLPDGLVATRLFDGLKLGSEPAAKVDLRSRGLTQPSTVGAVQAALSAASAAQSSLKKNGVPPAPRVRAGQTKGIFTDLHLQRFGALMSSARGANAADLGTVTRQVEALGRRGVEGFLVEAQRDGEQLQVSAMHLDGRNGVLRLDKPLARLDVQRRWQRPSRAVAQSASGTPLGTVRLDDVRQFDNTALFASLPADAFDLQDGNVVGSFALTEGLEFQRVGDTPSGRSVTSITLPPALRQRPVLNRFTAATRGVQTLWREPFEQMRVAVQTVDFGLAQAAQIVRARTAPELTLSARLASQVSIAQAAVGASHPHVAAYLPNSDQAAKLAFMIPLLQDRVMAWPHLREPMYQALAEVDQDAFMPGVSGLPPDLIMLVQVNQYFIDSFMVGANAEMNRELLWRGFPTDLRGTPFQRFWGRLGVRLDGSVEPLNDMAPIHHWGLQPLGRRNDPNLTDPDRVALLIKGQLLRRYPNSAVYAWKRRKNVPADESKLLKNNQGLPPDPATDIQTPVFAGHIQPDLTFFGFDIDRADIDDWCFVIEEVMGEPRFGFDVGDPVPGDPPGQAIGARRRQALSLALQEMSAGPVLGSGFAAVQAQGFNAYKALTWDHLAVQPGAFASVQALINVPQAPFASFPKLGPTPTAADIAKALIQEPFRAYWEGPDLAT